MTTIPGKKVTDTDLSRLSSIDSAGLIPFAIPGDTTPYVLRSEAINVGSPVANVFWNPSSEPSWLLADEQDVSGFGDLGDIDSLDYATLISYWEKLRAEYSTYISRTALGTSQDGAYTIYEYALTPAAPTRKMLWLTGEHGGEVTSMAITYRIAYHLCKNWAIYGGLGFLRHQVDFRIIPCLNPWGLDNASTPNSRGVNLTYNFACTNWADESDDAGTGSRLTPGATYRGPSAASEAETVIAQDWIASHLDAAAFISAHALGADTGDASVYYTMRENPFDDTPVREVVQWLDQYENDTWTNNVTNWVLGTKFAAETINCHAILVEFPDGHFSVAHDATEMLRALKWYGNIAARFSALPNKPVVTNVNNLRVAGGHFSQAASEIVVANGAYGDIDDLTITFESPGTGIALCFVDFVALNYGTQTNLFFRSWVGQIGTQFYYPDAAQHELAHTLPLGEIGGSGPSYTSMSLSAVGRVLQANNSGNDPQPMKLFFSAYAGTTLCRIWRYRAKILWFPQTDPTNALVLYDASAHVGDGEAAMTQWFPS